jgi:hypothetical protein
MKRRGKRRRGARGGGFGGAIAASNRATLAAEVARISELRRAGRFAEACSAAEAALAAHPTTPEPEERRARRRLVLEGALAAFAAGEDERALARAADDEEIARIVGALVGGARGDELPAVPRRTGLDSRGAQAQRAIAQAARAVALVRRGEHATAKTTLYGVAREAAAALGLAAMGPAIRLAGAETDRKRQRALADLDRRLPREVRTAALHEIVEHAPPRMIASAVLFRDLPLEVTVAARLRCEQRTRGDKADAKRFALSVARSLGHAGFTRTSPEERANAFLYEGFAKLDSNTKQALAAFDEALAEGADLVEVFRGNLLARNKATTACPDCGKIHPDDDTRGPAHWRAMAPLGERLVRALAKDEQADLLAACASLVAARYASLGGDAQTADAMIELAREKGADALRDPIDAAAGAALAMRDATASRVLLEALVSRSPRFVEGWNVRLELARFCGDREEMATVIARAAEATEDPVFMRDAQRIREATSGRLGHLPGASSRPGAVAAELIASLIGKGVDLVQEEDEVVAEHCARASLSSREQLAVEVACIAHMKRTGRFAGALVAAAGLRLRTTPSLLEELACAVGWLTGGDELVVCIVAAATTNDGLIVDAMFNGLCASGAVEAPRRALARVAALLDRSRLARIERLVGSVPKVSDAPATVVALHEILLPQVQLLEAEEQGTGELEDILDVGPSLLDMLCSMIELPSERVRAKLGPARVEELERQIRTGQVTEQGLPTILAELEALMGRGRVPAVQAYQGPDAATRRRLRNKRKQKKKRR